MAVSVRYKHTSSALSCLHIAPPYQAKCNESINKHMHGASGPDDVTMLTPRLFHSNVSCGYCPCHHCLFFSRGRQRSCTDRLTVRHTMPELGKCAYLSGNHPIKISGSRLLRVIEVIPQRQLLKSLDGK